MTVPYLGPRAAVLLGLLGKPMTAAEIVDHVGRAIEVADDLDFPPEVWGSPKLALQALHDSGVAGVLTSLHRLQDYGLVDSVSAGPFPELWSRVRLDASI